MKTLFAFLLLVSVVTGCSTATESSNTVPQDRIYQYYSVDYDAGRNVTSTFAEFRFGDFSGTTLQLAESSRINHNGERLSSRDFLGTHYTCDHTGFEPVHQFEFIDTQGKHYRNRLTLTSIAFGTVPPTLRRSISTVIAWAGEALHEAETITLVVENEATHESASFQASGVGATSVRLTPSADFSRVSVGKVEIQLRREQSLSLQEGTTRGGSLRGTYASPKREVILAD